MTPRRAALLLFAPLLLAPHLLSGQEVADVQYEEELLVVEVLLDVLVTDRYGSVILGLGKEDFVVEEEGRAVEIRGFSFYSNRRPVGLVGAEAQAELPPDERYFVLFFFRPPLRNSREALLHARLPAAGERTFEWLVEDLLPNDYVAVVAYDGALNLVHDFSQDRERLGTAISQASRGKAPKRQWPSRTAAPLPGKTLSVLSEQEDLRRRTDEPFAAIAALGSALGGIEGRKVLILLGADFPSAGSHEHRRGYRPMVEALNTHNVAVYWVDVAGRGVLPTPARLADDTGGSYLHRSRDVGASLREIQHENNGYYLLSYRSAFPAGERGYRRVRVGTVNPELRVRSRSGYSYGE